MRTIVEYAMERIVRHIETLPDQPLHATTGGKRLARSLREPMPERGVAFEKLVRFLFGRVLPRTLNTASPGYLAYIPGGGLFQSAVADLIALATNRYVGIFQAAPGLVQLEQNVIEWFASALGMPRGSGGVLSTGGSMANLIAVITARRERLPADLRRARLYASDQAHHSVRKAAVLAGFQPDQVIEIPSDLRFRIRIDALERAIAQARRQRLSPFLVVGSAGTTNTGAIDDLDALAEIAERRRLWLHVDAAYGGFFALTERGRQRMNGIARADSVTLDPHKGLFLPYGTGCLLVRDPGALRRTHAMTASYMPKLQSDADFVDFAELSPELSREARGLRVWLPLKMHGAGVFRAALDEKMDLAAYAAARLRSVAHVEIVAEPELSLLAFRLRPPRVRRGADLDALNRRLVARVNARQRVLLTGAVVRTGFVIRICVLSFRTHRDRIDACLEDIQSAIDEVMSAPSTTGARSRAPAPRRATGRAGSRAGTSR